MKSTSRIIASSAAVLLRLALAMITTPSAHAGEYCFSDASSSGMLSCDFATMQQCQDSASGRAGTCERDPFYGSANSAYAYQPERTHSRRGLRPVNGPVQ
jgi:hypothetical protein